MNDWDEQGWPAKKDKKRWCKGRVGREHVWRLTSWGELKGYAWAMEYPMRVCEKCGQQRWLSRSQQRALEAPQEP